MTDLQRAVAWLEQELEYYENFGDIPNNSESIANCRVLLDALRWIPCAERMPTDEAVQRAIEDVELDLQYAEIQEQDKVPVSVVDLRKIINSRKVN